MTKQYDNAEKEKAKEDFWRDIQKSIKELNDQVEKGKDQKNGKET